MWQRRQSGGIIGNNLISKEMSTDSSPKLKKLVNPGSVVDIFNACKEILPIFCGGVRLIWKTPLRKNFQLSHTFNPEPNGDEGYYRLGAHFVDNQRSLNLRSNPVLIGEIEKGGNMLAVVDQFLNDRIRIKLVAQNQGPQYLDTEYKGDTYTASVGMIRPNMISNSGVFFAHYLQSATQNLALGSELICQYEKFSFEDISSMCSFIVIYKEASSTLCASIGKQDMLLSYARVINPEFKFAAEFNTNFENQKTFTTLGYQFKPNENFSFRCSVDTNWNICSAMDIGLVVQELPITFTVSALFNEKLLQETFKLGCGLVFN